MVLWGNRVWDFHIFVIQRKEIVGFKELAGQLIGNELNWIVKRLGNEHLPCGLVGICMSAGLIDNASGNERTYTGRRTNGRGSRALGWRATWRLGHVGERETLKALDLALLETKLSSTRIVAAARNRGDERRSEMRRDDGWV